MPQLVEESCIENIAILDVSKDHIKETARWHCFHDSILCGKDVKMKSLRILCLLNKLKDYRSFMVDTIGR